MSVKVGQVIDGYYILERVGSGGNGVVYKAKSEEENQIVAIKIPWSENIKKDPRLMNSFSQEISVITRLDHPYIAKSYKAGLYRYEEEQETLTVPYLVMEFVQGIQLAEFQYLSTRSIIELMQKIAEAVGYAHKQRVIHRDLKPANIFIDHHSNPKILDFGLARLMDQISTSSGVFEGSPAYAAPEQFRGENCDERTDVWALGAILVELLTGEPPFVSENWDELTEVQKIFAVQELVLNKKVPRPSKKNPNIDKHLDAICLKALAKDASSRYQNAEEMAADLKQWGRVNRDLQAEKANRLFSYTGVFPKPLKRSFVEKAFNYLRQALSYETATAPLKNLALRLFKSEGVSDVDVAEMAFSEGLTAEKWQEIQEKFSRAMELRDQVIPIKKTIVGIGQGEELPRQVLLIYEKPEGENIQNWIGKIDTEQMMEVVRCLFGSIDQARQQGLQPALPDMSKIFVEPFEVIGIEWPFAEQEEISATEFAKLIYNLFTGITYDAQAPNWHKVPAQFRDILRKTLEKRVKIFTMEDLLDALEKQQEAYRILEEGILDRPFSFPPGEYQLNRTLRIESSGHLQLAHHTTFKMAPNVGIECFGQVSFQGIWDSERQQGSVCLVPSDMKEGWSGIYFNSSKDVIQLLEGCSLEGGRGKVEEGRACGGTIYAEAGNLKVVDSIFRNNRVEGQGGAIYLARRQNKLRADFTNVIFASNQAEGNGGALCILDCPEIIFSSCRFESNKADEDGGAIYQRGLDSNNLTQCDLQNCSFTENRSQISGGAILLGGYSTLTLDKCQYDGNLAEDSGGAIAATGRKEVASKLTLRATKFVNNRCQNRGGGILLKKNVQLTCEEGNFSSNSSDRDSGGALAIDGKGGVNNSQAHIVQSQFSENRCRVDGGAINANINSMLKMEKCRFEGNYSEDNSGGAVVIVGENENNFSEARFVRVVFYRNRCKLDGGAVNANLYSRSFFEACRFKNNSAEDSGGAIEIAGEEGGKATETNFKEVTFFGNRCKISGGAVNAIDFTKTTFENCRFENNRSEEDAGAIQIKGVDEENFSETLFRSVRFIENRSRLFAGAVYLHVFTRSKFEDCRFNSNQAEGKNGGAIQVVGKKTKSATEVILNRSVFTENFCGGDGGGLNLGFCSLAILDQIRFEKNFAENSGGAIGVIGKGDSATSKMTLRKTKFVENRCGVDGGAIAAGSHTQMIFDDCKFHANEAQENCGAIGIVGKADGQASKAKFRQVTFSENHCKGDGGAIAAGIHSRMIFEDCRFERNWADSCCGAIGIAGKDSQNLSDATLTRVVFHGNYCNIDGGAMILGRYSRVKFTDTLFEQNYAKQKTGGAILVLGGSPKSPTLCTFKSSKFIKNYCAVDGGAINANIYTHLLFENCVFEGNFVREKNGGALVLLGGEGECYTEATFRKVKFIKNHCHVSGGAINANDYTRSSFSECIFDGNRAITKNGGAVLILGENSQEPSDARFYKVQFKNNYCKASGGAVNAHVYTITRFEQCYFKSNVADENGGGIFVRGLRRIPNKAKIKDCHFLGNIAGNMGADVALHAVKGVTEASLMEENIIEIPPPDFQEEEREEEKSRRLKKEETPGS